MSGDTPKKNILPDLVLLGSRTGPPTLDDMIALCKHLGFNPTPASIARCQAKLDAAGYPIGPSTK